MSRFFFHIADADHWTEDRRGIELAHAKAAWIEAKNLARDLAAQMIRARKPVDARKILVIDARGILIHEIAIRDAVKELGH